MRTPEWTAEPQRHFFDITTEYVDGHVQRNNQEYAPAEFSESVEVSVPKDAANVRVQPYLLEQLCCPVEVRTERGIVDELVVGIRDGAQVQYVGTRWHGRQSGEQRSERYFFHENQPAGYSGAVMLGNDWPLGQPMRTRQYAAEFRALKQFRPDAAKSIAACVRRLRRGE